MKCATDTLKIKKLFIKWGKVFKNGSSEICGRQPLKNFTWSILEYLVPNLNMFPRKASNIEYFWTLSPYLEWTSSVAEQ